MYKSYRKPEGSVLIVIVVCLIFFLSIFNVHIVHGDSPTTLATTWIVPDDFSTIQSAINAATTGDTILVAAGVYTENLLFNGKAITLQSINGPLTTIINGNNVGKTVNIGPQGQISGFKIINGQDYFGAGMAVNGAGTIIKGNIFESNVQSSGGFGAAIGGNVASPIIDGNIFRNNSCDSQFLSGVVSFVNSSSPQIINNIFEANPCRAINMTLPVGTTPLVSNNTIVNNRVGIRVDARVNTIAQVYQNNIIINNTIGLQVDFGSSPNYPTWRNNLVFGNNTNYSGILDRTGDNGNISANPLFVNTPNSNYELMINSPAINTGSNVNCPLTDFRSLARSQGGTCEIGAYEFGLVIPPTYVVYLPLVISDLPLSSFPLYIGNAIPKHPVDDQGEIFYTKTLQLPNQLPPGGNFYLSARADVLAQVLVDDEVVILLNDVEVFSHNFSPSGSPQLATVKIPRTIMDQLAGQTVNIQYRDIYGVDIRATEMWWIWVP